MNRDTAITQANLNRINQVTPEGRLTYSIDGYNSDGTPKVTQTQTYSPTEQAKYEQQNKVALALNNTAIDNIARVQQAQSTPFNYDGMTPLATNVGGNNPFTLSGGSATPTLKTGTQAGALNYGVGTGGVRDTVAGGDIQRNIAGAGTAQGVDPSAAGRGVQGSLDYSKLTGLPGTENFGAEARRVSDSVYSQAASRLDPRFKQGDSDMRARLAAQGITENSDAYRRELDNMSRDRNDAYNQATYSAVQAGANEQSRLFGMAMGARQQGQNEANTQGAFVNSAQEQAYGQMLQAQQANQGVQGQNYGQNANNAAFYNQAQQQQFGQDVQGAQLYNQAQQQAYGQRSNEAELNNQAQGQAFDQDARNTEQYNQSQQQTFANNQANIAMNNQAQTQYFNQSAADAAFNNQARQQQIQEATYLRNLPLNDIAALLSGNAAVAPQFQNYAQVGVAAPDYQGIVQSNYSQAMQNYQQQQANRSAGLGSIFGTVGQVAGMAMMSDRRMKENIKRIGTLANGIATYAFNYIGDRAQQFGVMAQEVLKIIPSAVIERDGIMYVDYGRVY